MEDQPHKTPVEEMMERRSNAEPASGLETKLYFFLTLMVLAGLATAGAWHMGWLGKTSWFPSVAFPVIETEPLEDFSPSPVEIELASETVDEVYWNEAEALANELEAGIPSIQSEATPRTGVSTEAIEALENTLTRDAQNLLAEDLSVFAELLTPPTLSLAEIEQQITKAKASAPEGSAEYYQAWMKAIVEGLNHADSPDTKDALEAEMQRALQAKTDRIETLSVRPYNGWSYQAEILSQAPDFNSLYQPQKLDPKPYRTYMSLAYHQDPPVALVQNSASHVYVFYDNALGEPVQGSMLIGVGESPREKAEILLERTYQSDAIDAQTYQHLFGQLTVFSDHALTQAEQDWNESTRENIEEVLVSLRPRIADWRAFNENQVPGATSFNYYHDDLDQVMQVSFLNRSYRGASGADVYTPEEVNNQTWYKRVWLGKPVYVWFPQNGPTHRVEVTLAPESARTDYQTITEEHQPFIEYLMKKFPPRVLEPYSWEFWDL